MQRIIKKILIILLPFVIQTALLPADEQVKAKKEEANSKNTDVPDPLLGAPLKTIPDVLAESEEKRKGLISWDPTEPISKEWNRLNSGLKKHYNLNLGIAYTSLYQGATTKLHYSDRRYYQGASAGDFDLFGVLTLQGQDTCHPSSIGFSSEARHKYSSIPPRLLGDDIGSLWETVNTFNTQQYSLIQLWWELHLIKNKMGFRLGKIDTTDYFSLYSFISSNFCFVSKALTDNVTINFPINGFGLIFAAFLPRNCYLRATIADANAVKTSMSFDTFFNLHEYFTAVELGYMPRNKHLGRGNYNVTFWHSDRRKKLRIPDSKGIAFSFEQGIGQGFITFVRLGFSDGRVRRTKQEIATGIGRLAPFSRKDDECAIGFVWGKPSEKNRRNQYMIEAYYRLQFTNHLQVSPDIQVIMNPTYNPEKNVIGVFGVRVRFDT